VKGTDQSASESSDGEMSEDDWASLNRVFDLEGHVDAAFDATNSLSAAMIIRSSTLCRQRRAFESAPCLCSCSTTK